MAFPIYYEGKILFRDGQPAFSTDCCCECPCNGICVFRSGGGITGLFLFRDDGTTALQFTQGSQTDGRPDFERLSACSVRAYGRYVGSILETGEETENRNGSMTVEYSEGNWILTGDGLSYSFPAGSCDGLQITHPDDEYGGQFVATAEECDLIFISDE